MRILVSNRKEKLLRPSRGGLSSIRITLITMLQGRENAVAVYSFCIWLMSKTMNNATVPHAVDTWKDAEALLVFFVCAGVVVGGGAAVVGLLMDGPPRVVELVNAVDGASQVVAAKQVDKLLASIT